MVWHATRIGVEDFYDALRGVAVSVGHGIFPNRIIWLEGCSANLGWIWGYKTICAGFDGFDPLGGVSQSNTWNSKVKRFPLHSPGIRQYFEGVLLSDQHFEIA